MTSYPLDVAGDAHITVHFRTDLDRISVLQYKVQYVSLIHNYTNCLISVETIHEFLQKTKGNIIRIYQCSLDRTRISTQLLLTRMKLLISPS